MYLGNPDDLRDSVGDIFARKVTQIPKSQNRFRIGANLKFLKLLIFRFVIIFQFFVVAPHQRFFEIFEKVQFLHDHEELDIGNRTVIFSERSSFRKANNF